MLQVTMISRIRALFELYPTWAQLHPHLKPIILEMGRKLSTQEVYDIVHPEEVTLAPCGKEKKFNGFGKGYGFCGRFDVCPCALQKVNNTYTTTDPMAFDGIIPDWDLSDLEKEKLALENYRVDLEKFLTVHGIDHHRIENVIVILGTGLAINIVGILSGSEMFCEKNYHLTNRITWDLRGSRLLTINSDEWALRSEVIKSTITHLLQKSPRGASARHLSMTEISKSDANNFFDHNHIQGKTGSINYALGAFEGNQLVGAMAFNNQRITGDIELIRFCSDGKARAGLFSRLFHHSVKTAGYSEVKSFADLRYSNGGVYSINGFALDNEIRADYRYVYDNRTQHKSCFTKKAIARKFGIDMSVITEKQAMRQLGIPRIYDCGKLRFIWKAS